MIIVHVPEIVTANTWKWIPCHTSAGRRSMEKRRKREFQWFLSQLPKMDNIVIDWEYRETKLSVYKHFSVFRNGKKSNIKGLAAECRKNGVILKW